jgi:Holliday junction resolvase
MGKMSKDKGKRGEREFAALLRDRGFEARRGVQHSGGPDSPDVVHSMDNVHFEVKRTEKLAIWPALEQADIDSKGSRYPVVAHKPNRKPWIVVMYASDFFDILEDAKS